jgi:hypothetical protein
MFTIKMIDVKDVMENDHISEPRPSLSMIVSEYTKKGMIKIIRECATPVKIHNK